MPLDPVLRNTPIQLNDTMFMSKWMSTDERLRRSSLTVAIATASQSLLGSSVKILKRQESVLECLENLVPDKINGIQYPRSVQSNLCDSLFAKNEKEFRLQLCQGQNPCQIYSGRSLVDWTIREKSLEFLADTLPFLSDEDVKKYYKKCVEILYHEAYSLFISQGIRLKSFLRTEYDIIKIKLSHFFLCQYQDFETCSKEILAIAKQLFSELSKLEKTTCIADYISFIKDLSQKSSKIFPEKAQSKKDTKAFQALFTKLHMA